MTKAKGSQHSPELRAAVVAALLAGQSVSQVAKQYKLPKGTVSAWKRRKAAGVAARVQPTATQKGDVDDLLFELVNANLRGLIAGAALLEDTDWIRKQGASDLGVLLGITHDKTVRMLEALGASANG